MSVSNLLVNGRQSNTNIHANTLTLAQLTTTERNALVPEDGALVYDTTLDKLFVRANGAWEQLRSSVGTAGTFVLFGPTASRSISSGTFVNVMTSSNVSAPVFGGIPVNTSGFAVIPATGTYRVFAQITVNPPAPITSGSVALSITDGSGTVGYFRAVMIGFSVAAPSINQWSLSTGGLVQLTAGATVTMFIENTGTGVNLTSSAMGTGPRLTYITIEQV